MVDERSAGFVALGIAQQTKKPVIFSFNSAYRIFLKFMLRKSIQHHHVRIFINNIHCYISYNIVTICCVNESWNKY